MRFSDVTRFGQFMSIFSKSLNLSPRLSAESKTGLFSNPYLRDASGFYLLRENARQEAAALVAEARSPRRKRKMVQIFDNLSNCLCRVADMAEFVRLGHPHPRFAIAAEEASIAISIEVEQLNTDRQLYEALKKVVDSGDIVPTTHLDDYVARLFLFDFEQSGIHLDEERRKLIVNLNERILHVGSYFTQNTTAKRSISKSSLHREVGNCFSAEGDNIIVSGLFPESDNELVRESAYKIFLYPDQHQNDLLVDLLMLRRNLAQLCGFKSYAERAIRGSIADTPQAVQKFLDLLAEGIREPAGRDYSQMNLLKRQSKSFSGQVFPWDVPYFAAAFKQTKYSQQVTACAPYFTLGSCLGGLDMICRTLFDIQLNVTPAAAGETWHNDVVKVSVSCQTENRLLGVIYCDLFERPGKSHQDCHFTIQGGCELPDGSYQMPIVVLMLSMTKPFGGSPTFLTPHQVDNLFHEMGHAIHSMTARTPYQHITGTRCSTDLAEVPSILMEYFASDPRVLKMFAKHYSTGDPIPSDLLGAWIGSRKVFNAADTQLQTFYSVLDQVYHSEDPLMGSKDTTEVLKHVQNKYYGLPYVEDTAWQLRFGHLVGYGAKYYSYLVSRAVAHSIWQRVFADDPLSPDAGKLYKQKVLSVGGGRHPREIAEAIMGTAASPEHLADCILSEVRSFAK